MNRTLPDDDSGNFSEDDSLVEGALTDDDSEGGLSDGDFPIEETASDSDSSSNN
ncbi:hypothetical protein [Endozoicomonas sp. YOMI1]|uniref:hypothetical protein n=1 Tax=Endozoicomonas sp. YOMI1 TaxID=2828739 RepID=UPI0021481C52|nr:hypothetical protein [Endozoicomonas sp. YOMI1]